MDLPQPADPARTRYPPWAIGGWFVLWMVVNDWNGTDHGVIRHAEVWGRDFINLWTGGKLIATRDYATLYTPQAYQAFQQALFGPLDPHIYSYPPTSFPIASLFSALPYMPALLTWITLTSVLFIAAARFWWPKNGGPAWLAILTPAGLVNLWVGHFGFLFGAIYLAAFRCLDKRPMMAGALIGLFVIKPQLAILIPPVLLIRRDWRAIFSAAASTIAMIVASGLIYGWTAWEAFLTRAAGKQISVIDAHGAFFGKMSASAATAILDVGGSWTLAMAGQAILAIVGIAFVSVAAWRRVRTDQLALLIATCTFLVLPYSINYDLVVACLGAWVVMSDAANPPIDRALATIGFIAPQIGIVLGILGVPVTSLMLAALAIAQFRVAMAGLAAPAGAGAVHSA